MSREERAVAALKRLKEKLEKQTRLTHVAYEGYTDYSGAHSEMEEDGDGEWLTRDTVLETVDAMIEEINAA